MYKGPMYSVMADIIATDCPRILYDPPPGGSRIAINTLTGEAECECGETWTYGAAELLEILNNLED